MATHSEGGAELPEHIASRHKARLAAHQRAGLDVPLHGESFTLRTFDELMQEPRFCSIPVSMLRHMRTQGKSNLALAYHIARHHERTRARERAEGQAAINAAILRAFPRPLTP